MSKITAKSSLNVGTELTLDTSAKTITLNVAGNLVAKDGVTVQALYSKLVDLWTTSTYNKFPFPMYAIDAKSGQYQFGTDGQTYNGWAPADDNTRSYLRDGGWSEYNSSGVLQKQYVGAVSLGTVSAGSQLYYQVTNGGSATNATYTDAMNLGVKVYDSTGPVDTRTYMKVYCREAGKTYSESTLSDTGQTATGAYIANFLISNGTDLKVTVGDGSIGNAPYSGITTTWIVGNGFTAAQVGSLAQYDVRQDAAGRWFIASTAGTIDAAGVADYHNNGGSASLTAYTGERQIGSSYYPFSVIVAGNSATAEQIYTKVQYLLRQNSDIDAGAGTRTGKITASLMSFLGDTLYTTTGVYIDNYAAADTNRLVFTDSTGTQRTNPFQANGNFTFNSYLSSGGTGYYRLYFTDLPGTADYGLAGAVTVKDAASADITGTISGSSIAWTFDYDGSTQGGRTAGTDATVTLVAGNAGVAKPVVVSATITRATGQTISAVAEADRAYL